jgi:hypothetical protein
MSMSVRAARDRASNATLLPCTALIDAAVSNGRREAQVTVGLAATRTVAAHARLRQACTPIRTRRMRGGDTGPAGGTGAWAGAVRVPPLLSRAKAWPLTR